MHQLLGGDARGHLRVYMQGVYSRDMTRLVGEVEDLRQMMESMKRIVTGLGLEEKGEETRDRVAELGKAEEKCEGAMTLVNNPTEGNRKGTKKAGRIFSEDMDTVIEIEVEHGTEADSRQLMAPSGTQFLANVRIQEELG